MAQQQRSKHVPQRKRQQIAAHILLGHAVKPHQDQRVSEKDRVVEKSLGQHQHKTENRTPAMFVDDCIPNFMPGCMCAGSNAREEQVSVAAVCDRRTFRNTNLSFHVADNLLRLLIAAMNHQPTRTLRNPTAKENHNETERRTDSKGTSPSQPDRYPARIE